MAFLAALIAFGSRFAGKVLTTALGWASTLLFGRVPASRQILLLMITFGSVIWLVMLAGVIVPEIGAFLLVLLPPQSVIPDAVIRLVMLIGVLVVPGVVGVLTLALGSDEERPVGRARVASIARGYPLTVLLAILLVFLAGLAIWRKAFSLAKRWTDAHVPMVVEPGRYEDVAGDLDRALSAAGLDLAATPAPASMSLPAKWLARVAGRSSSALVPDRMVQLRGPDLDILIYPMDVLISGKPTAVMRSRAAIASRLTTAAAHLTVSAEAQSIEDRLARVAKGRPSSGAPGDLDSPPFDDTTAAEFGAIDQSLATIDIPYDEWEVLYRQRLQVERDLRAATMVRAEAAGEGGGARIDFGVVTRLVRQGATAVIDAATDDATIAALDRLAGPRWRLAAQAADVAVVAAKAAITNGEAADDAMVDASLATGEPLMSRRAGRSAPLTTPGTAHLATSEAVRPTVASAARRGASAEGLTSPGDHRNACSRSSAGPSARATPHRRRRSTRRVCLDGGVHPPST